MNEGEEYESGGVAAVKAAVPVVAFVVAGTMMLHAHGTAFWVLLAFVVLFGLAIFTQVFGSDAE